MTKQSCYAHSPSVAVRVGRGAWLVLALVALGGCAGMRLEAPRVTVSRVEVERLTAADARFGVVVAMSNPNDRAIDVEAIEARLRIEDVVIGTARLAEPVRLPAKGDATARLQARGDLASSLRAMAQVASRAQLEGDAFSAIRYAVDGTATIDGGSTYPFSRRGEIAWNPRTR